MLLEFILAVAVAAALLAVELKDLEKAIIALAAMSALVALAHYVAGARLLAVFQLSVYAGAITMLTLSVLHLGGEHAE